MLQLVVITWDWHCFHDWLCCRICQFFFLCEGKFSEHRNELIPLSSCRIQNQNFILTSCWEETNHFQILNNNQRLTAWCIMFHGCWAIRIISMQFYLSTFKNNHIKRQSCWVQRSSVSSSYSITSGNGINGTIRSPEITQFPIFFVVHMDYISLDRAVVSGMELWYQHVNCALDVPYCYQRLNFRYSGLCCN